MNKKSTYRPEIDGLRCVAVLAVLASHFKIDFLEGGYIGVDMFFVISGFLIASIIFNQLETSLFSFKEFYVRRILRIMPALFTTVLLTVFFSFFIFMPDELLEIGYSGLASIFSLANIYFWQNMGYFDGASIEKPFLHTWSLSVEEQFYLFFPFALYILYRFVKPAFKFTLFFVAAVSFSIAVWGAYEQPGATFFLPVTRAWELLLGALLVFYPVAKQLNKYADFFIYAGFMSILFSLLAYEESTIFPGLNALLPTLGTALIIAFGKETNNQVTRLLKTRLFLWVGKISYSLYLLHWPVLVLSQYYLMRPLDLVEKIATFGLTITAALLMQKYIEEPFRKADVKNRKRNLIITAILFTFSTAFLFMIVNNKGFPYRFEHLNITAHSKPKTEENFKRCFHQLEDTKYKEFYLNHCNINNGTGQKVLLVGDSYARHYAFALNSELDKTKYALYQLTASSCPILNEFKVEKKGCGDFVNKASDMITRLSPDIIIMSANWWSYSRDAGLLQAIKNNIEKYQKEGAEVIFMGVSPVYPSQVPYIAMRQQSTKIENNYTYFNQFDELLDEQLKQAVQGAGAEYFSSFDLLCEKNICKYGDEKGLYHVDHGHLSNAGSLILIKEMKIQTELLL